MRLGGSRTPRPCGHGDLNAGSSRGRGRSRGRPRCTRAVGDLLALVQRVDGDEEPLVPRSGPGLEQLGAAVAARLPVEEHGRRSSAVGVRLEAPLGRAQARNIPEPRPSPSMYRVRHGVLAPGPARRLGVAPVRSMREGRRSHHDQGGTVPMPAIVTVPPRYPPRRSTSAIVALGGGVADAADTIFSSDIVGWRIMKTADVATGAVPPRGPPPAEIANNQVLLPRRPRAQQLLRGVLRHRQLLERLPPAGELRRLHHHSGSTGQPAPHRHRRVAMFNLDDLAGPALSPITPPGRAEMASSASTASASEPPRSNAEQSTTVPNHPAGADDGPYRTQPAARPRPPYRPAGLHRGGRRPPPGLDQHDGGTRCWLSA